MAPFVVFSLPRSRSAWLSVLLAGEGGVVGHDIAPTLTSPLEFGDRLRDDLIGTCETGAAFAWPAIREMAPNATFAVVRRSPDAVAASLERFGLTGYRAELADRAEQLEQIARLSGTFVCDFHELRRQDRCAALYRHCLGRPMPQAWWTHLDRLNIQVDMARQLELLAGRREEIQALKAEARRMMNAQIFDRP